ncbi:hypothetical protein [Kitasatospora sp. NPDC094015]|uniref:hypothetical protein n=1 Tax=Kitasatospora sp. NPDC094015 TaxID=3155205 RepID=UPI0033312DBA
MNVSRRTYRSRLRSESAPPTKEAPGLCDQSPGPFVRAAIRELPTCVTLALPARGQHRAVPVEAEPTALAATTEPVPQSEPETASEGLESWPLVRPYVDHVAWRAELDEKQRQYERREALRAVADEQPDPGYTYDGAHSLAGAVA